LLQLKESLAVLDAPLRKLSRWRWWRGVLAEQGAHLVASLEHLNQALELGKVHLAVAVLVDDGHAALDGLGVDLNVHDLEQLLELLVVVLLVRMHVPVLAQIRLFVRFALQLADDANQAVRPQRAFFGRGEREVEHLLEAARQRQEEGVGRATQTLCSNNEQQEAELDESVGTGLHWIGRCVVVPWFALRS